MSKYCKIYGLTYVKNYGNDEDPHMVDLIHFKSEYAKDKLADYVKAKVGYYLVQRVVMGSHFCKLSDFYNDCDDDLGYDPCDFYLEFYPPKHLGVRSPLIMLPDERRFYFDRMFLGNYLDVNLIPKLKKYRYVYEGEIRKLLCEIEISIFQSLLGKEV